MTLIDLIQHAAIVAFALPTACAVWAIALGLRKHRTGKAAR